MLRYELNGGSQPGEAIAAGVLVSALQMPPSSVTGLLRATAAAGLINYTARHGACLTATGRTKALQLLRRHRLVETYLQSALGLDWAEVHDEAERIDAGASERVIERMAEVLGHPAHDPHGDPIPDRAGRLPATQRPCCAAAVQQEDNAAPQAGPVCSFAVGQFLMVVHVVGNDTAFLRLCGSHGIKPGALVEITANDAIGGTVCLSASGGGALTLSRTTAARIHVETTPVRSTR